MNLQAFVTAVLLIAAWPAHAEPTPEAGALPTPSRAGATLPFSAPADKTPASGAAEGAVGDDSKNESHAASVMKEHLARGEQFTPPPNPRGANPQAGPLSKGQITNGNAEAADTGFSAALKDFVRPLQEGVAQSGLMEAVRNFESDIGLSKRPDSADPSSRNYSTSAPGTGAPAKTAEQIRRDQIAASMMFDEFIQEVKPWVFGLAGVLVLGYLVKLWLTYLRVKAARPGKHRRSARRRHRHRSE